MKLKRDETMSEMWFRIVSRRGKCFRHIAIV